MSQPAHQPCDGIERFETREMALRIANRKRPKRRGAVRSQPYKCRYCGHWHVGTERRSKWG